MNTFLPFPDINQSIQCLDYRRLGKQRVEAFQCLCALGDEWALNIRRLRTGKTEPYKGWVNHPAVKMWRGHEGALRLYYNQTIREWVSRGYNNTMLYAPPDIDELMPDWWGDGRVHSSHRGRLMDKDADWYSQFFASDPIPAEVGYYWPV